MQWTQKNVYPVIDLRTVIAGNEMHIKNRFEEELYPIDTIHAILTDQQN